MTKRRRRQREYEVEKVLAKKKTDAGDLEYLVKWNGYSTDEASWEPAANLANCTHLVVDYENRHDAQHTSSTEARRSTRRRLSTTKKAKPLRTSSPEIDVIETAPEAASPAGIDTATAPQSPPPAGATSVAAPPPPSPLCKVCDTSGGVHRKCDRYGCGVPLHHFCSHDVAVSLGLKDFGDHCYCSRTCYEGRTERISSQVQSSTIRELPQGPKKPKIRENKIKRKLRMPKSPPCKSEPKKKLKMPSL